MQKRILMLGGSPFQIPPITYAQSQGHHVIVCDYYPDCPGGEAADEFHNVSTTDFDAILEVAKTRHVDGIMTYASDPAAPTVAYVGNELGLPSNPYESVRILARKDLFREFLAKHGFHTPKAVSSYKLDEAVEAAADLEFPIVVKPVDSSGSKGVTRLYEREKLAEAFEYALGFSREKKVVLEEFVDMDRYQIAGDGFVYQGQLAFRCFANEHFDTLCNDLVPIGESFPSVFTEAEEAEVHAETQRLMDLLAIDFCALNFDVRIDKQGRVFLMEIGPRNGGNLIPEVIRYATGVDLIKYTVDAALGLDCSGLEMRPATGFYASYIFHALESGIVQNVFISGEMAEKFVEKNIFVKPGDEVSRFDGSNCTLGTGIIKFDSMGEMLDCMDHMEARIRIAAG